MMKKTKRWMKRWTKQEIHILKKYWTNKETLLNLLPDRSYRTIRSKAATLNLKRGITQWTKNELNTLKKHWDANYHQRSADTNWNKVLPNRTIASIRVKGQSIGLKKLIKTQPIIQKKKMRKDAWTKPELDLIKRRWEDTEPHQWIHLLPDRTYDSIKNKATRLNLKKNKEVLSKKHSQTCVICNKKFKAYGKQITCGMKCHSKHMSETRLGENNPHFKENKWIVANCLNCGLEFKYQKGGTHSTRKYCSNKCSSEHLSGPNASQWRGGIDFLPYSYKFNKRLKQIIKERDNNRCVLCPSSNRLSIHHIDYDKMNCEENNLITLCSNHHSMTNSNRRFWQQVFEFIMSGYTIIKKGWGFEFVPVSTNDYCLKALVFYPTKRFSDHYHLIKDEAWYCLVGKMFAKLTHKDGKIDEFMFKKGKVIEVASGISHQLIALEPTILLEVSTKDRKEDSYRVKKGD